MLGRWGERVIPDTGSGIIGVMRVMPIRYSADVAAALAFYRALGLDPDGTAAPGVWTELPAASGELALHAADAGSGLGSPGTVELAFVADEPLDAVRDRLVAAGFAPEPIADEPFGRSFGVVDPDGVRVQVNEHA